MSHCPACHAENSPSARFCADCGARLAQPPSADSDVSAALPDAAITAAASAADPHAQPASKRTVVLKVPQLDSTERLARQPADDETIVAEPAISSSALGNAASTPTSALPAAAQGDSTAPVPAPPSAIPAAQARSSGSTHLWLIVALVAFLGLGGVAALAGGLLLSARGASQPASSPTSETGSGLARLPAATPHPTVAPSTATPSGFHDVLLEDRFDDPGHSSLTEDRTANATYAFAGGAYAIHVNTPKYIVWSPLDGVYGDAAVDIDATLDSGSEENAAGIIFRYQDEDNFYFFSISASGSYSLDLYKQNDRQALIDWTDSPAINGPGQKNHLRVEAVGDRIRLFVNGTLLDEISDDTWTTGKLALAVNTFSKGDTTFTFDNLIVRGTK